MLFTGLRTDRRERASPHDAPTDKLLILVSPFVGESTLEHPHLRAWRGVEERQRERAEAAPAGVLV